MARTLPIDALQPSQLYLNGRKLALGARWFSFDDPEYDPIPVVEFDGKPVPTDGHTRAFLAWLAGADTVVVRDENDDIDRSVYRECVRWCREADVTHVGDLAGRVVDEETWERNWVRRCQAAAERLG